MHRNKKQRKLLCASLRLHEKKKIKSKWKKRSIHLAPSCNGHHQTNDKKKRKSFVGELSSVNTFCFLSLFRRFLHVLVTVLAPFTFRSLYLLGFFCQRWWIHRHITCALSTCWFKGEIFWIGTKNKKLQQTKIGYHEMLFFHYSVSQVVRGRHREQIKFA